MCCELGNCRALSHLEMVSDEAIRYYQPLDFLSEFFQIE